jgi:hypothetical protein
MSRGRPLRSLVLAALAVACSPAPSAMPSQAPPSPTAPPGSTNASMSPSAAPSIAPTPQGSLDRAGKWQADLALIVPGIERIHPDPWRGTPKAEVEAAVADLSARAGTLSDEQLLVGVSRIAAMISTNACDGHTGLFMWGTGTYPLTSLPLRLWLFGDDLVIVDALPPHQDLIGATIGSIEGTPIADVRALLDPIVPRDNAQTVRLLTPRYLLIPEVLRGIGLSNDRSVRFRFTDRAGAVREVDLAGIPMEDYNNWAGPYGLHLPADPDVRWLSKIDDDLWWEVLPDGRTLYVQYNRVEYLPATRLQELRNAVTDPELERVVLDIRHNFGGEVPVLDEIEPIFDDPAVDQPGKLVVLVGRNTWSAGSMLLARLEAHTGAVIVGEPMAGCPTFYGDVVELPLPHSGLTLLVTEMLEVGVDPNDTRTNVELDASAELTREDWENGLDPALELVVPVAP